MAGFEAQTGDDLLLLLLKQILDGKGLRSEDHPARSSMRIGNSMFGDYSREDGGLSSIPALSATSLPD
jgi:hypothetical protein